jgi:hypothetical protein
MPKGLFLVGGIMPLKKPTTRKYPRMPKIQEPEAGEGSSPVVARQLEFSPKSVPVIKTTTKNNKHYKYSSILIQSCRAETKKNMVFR